MGGKSKQPRVKNNARPSNSSRSAELLGNAANCFVGFSAHAQHGMIPLAPGFSESKTEFLSSSADPQLQVILRKMSKKDPVTKVKALQEFSELLNAYDVESVKKALPLWPKLYHNLAIDVDHRVREGTQDVMKTIALKCKKSIAPYLKQLVPVWLASTFDNYAPVASIASSGLECTFACNANKVREVCIYCQTEIMEYITRNLTFHTVASVASTKTNNPEEAEQRYKHVVYCSLKALSFFLEISRNCENDCGRQSVKDLMENSKFWSFCKSKDLKIRTAWFEVLENILQTAYLLETVSIFKQQLISVTFQNMRERDPVIASLIWKCITSIQEMFTDWYEIANFERNVAPTLLSLLRDGCHGNISAVYPNLLSFISKIPQNSGIIDFYKRFIDNLKEGVTSIKNSTKAEHSSIFSAYFECVDYIMKAINTDIQRKSDESVVQSLNITARKLLEENILNLLIWSLEITTSASKFVMIHTSNLLSSWVECARDSKLFEDLVNTFWKDILSFITDRLEKKSDEVFMDGVIELIDKLYFVSSKVEEQEVKFIFQENDNKNINNNNDDNNILPSFDKDKLSTSKNVKSVACFKYPIRQKSALSAYIESDLKTLVVQVIRLCLENCALNQGSNYISKIRKLSNVFNDCEFYKRISEDDTIEGALNIFLKIMNYDLDDVACDDVVALTFELLQFLSNEERLHFIEKCLLKISSFTVQCLVLERLLSNPMITEPEVYAMLSSPDVSLIVIALAKNVLTENSTVTLNLLRKCFFQNEKGNIPIARETAEAILNLLCGPLVDWQTNQRAAICGSFIAQVMPVICSEGNTSPEFQHQLFLTLFKLSIEQMCEDNINEDTIWEISTCWQDALSSRDIVYDSQLLRDCKLILERVLSKCKLTADVADSIATSITRFINCSAAYVNNDEERLQKVNLLIKEFFDLDANDTFTEQLKCLQNACTFLEALLGRVSASEYLEYKGLGNEEMLMTFGKTLLNCCVLHKLIFDPSRKLQPSKGKSDKNTEKGFNRWPTVLYNEIVKCISVASVGDSLLCMSLEIPPTLKMLMLQLSEMIKLFLSNGPDEFISALKDHMLDKAIRDIHISTKRNLLYLAYINQYYQFEENATILLFENLSELFLSKNSLETYIHALQFLLPKLEHKVITTEMPAMNLKFSKVWMKAALLRCIIQNNFNSDYNDKTDRNIISETLNFISEIFESQKLSTYSNIFKQRRKECSYSVDMHMQPTMNIIETVEFINVLKEAVIKFPHEFTIKTWDTVRICLDSWVLSVSKSKTHFQNPHVALFTASVFQLFSEFIKFINSEKQKSSTEFLKNVIDEWENLFSREISLVLFESYCHLLGTQEFTSSNSPFYVAFLEALTPAMEYINYGIIFNFHKSSNRKPIKDVVKLLLKNLSGSHYCVQTICVYILRQLSEHYIELDVQNYDNRMEAEESKVMSTDSHFLNIFMDSMECFRAPVDKYLKEFSFKTSEIVELQPISKTDGLPYLFLWDCIIYICKNSPITLRSLYTNWLTENHYEEAFLHFLFRAMPVEILKNFDVKGKSADVFKGLEWDQIKDRNLSLEKYVCHLYTEVLRKLPAVVRRWWNTCHSRQKTFIDKLTTNYVSTIICNEELKALSCKKDKHENMQITIHNSTREVLAVYSIDEARMELAITLAQNHPLGSVKVEVTKQIGGRSSSRNTGMQLTIFLTHQNGSIYDGLTLWKKNLDKKFEGVEECYICYTVIHQDTCQLPKLTCKTCKKKFHGPCLYKWFTTSSKSTCPICRNVF